MKIASLVATFLLTIALACGAMAAPNNGGGAEGVKETCEVSGGTFTGSEGGNWACCWSDWGCYGCVDGNCKIKCTTQRCRRANAASAASQGNAAVPGLAPKGMKAPVVPKERMKPSVNRSSM